MVPLGERSLKFYDFDASIRATSVTNRLCKLFAKTYSSSASYSRLDERLTASRLSPTSLQVAKRLSWTSPVVHLIALCLSLPPFNEIMCSIFDTSKSIATIPSLTLRLVTDVIFYET